MFMLISHGPKRGARDQCGPPILNAGNSLSAEHPKPALASWSWECEEIRNGMAPRKSKKGVSLRFQIPCVDSETVLHSCIAFSTKSGLT